MPIDYKKKPVKPPCIKRTIIVSSGLLYCYNRGAVKRFISATYVYQAIMEKSDVRCANSCRFSDYVAQNSRRRVAPMPQEDK